jgi:hypothetical protein
MTHTIHQQVSQDQSFLPTSLLAYLLTFVPLTTLVECSRVNRHFYMATIKVLYTRPVLDVRYGSPFTRFRSLLRALGTLPDHLRVQIRDLDLYHVEETMYDTLPVTWLRHLVQHCPALTSLRLSEKNTFLSLSSVRQLTPGALASLRRLTLDRVETLSGVGLATLLSATSRLEELQLINCAAADRNGLAAVAKYTAATLRRLALIDCKRVQDHVLNELWQMESGKRLVYYPQLTSLELVRLPLSDAAMTVLGNVIPRLAILQRRVTNAGILAVIVGRRRTPVRLMPTMPHHQSHFYSLDLRALPHATAALLSHLIAETPYLQRLHVDLGLLNMRSTSDIAEVVHLSQLARFTYLEHLVVDAGEEAGSMYGQKATPWWRLCRGLLHLKTLTFIGRWQSPISDAITLDGDWGWTVPIEASSQYTVLHLFICLR